MTEFRDSYRLASVILVDDLGDVIGQLAPLKLSSPWFQEIGELVEAALHGSINEPEGKRVGPFRVIDGGVS